MIFNCINLGCKVNRVESDAVMAHLVNQGHSQGSAAQADLILVNTCTVTGEAEKKTRKTVRQALKANDHARVILTGCAVAIDQDFYLGLSDRVQVVPKARLMEQVLEHASMLQRTQALAGEGFRTRVGVKVQDGCNNACTYCIVHVARGRSVSRPADQIVAECAALARAGVREVVLTGINLGSYFQGESRQDPNALRLPQLLQQILDATDLPSPDGAPAVRFRIGSVEPRDVSPELMQLMAQNPQRLCRHLHLPLQSGSSKVLREMARPYSAEYFADLVKRFRELVPDLALSTDVITGFPGETDQDFQQTVDLCRACGFMKLHVFPYSKRAGTPAAKRMDQIDPQVKAARATTLRQLSDQLAAEDQQRRAGSCEWALVEGQGRATVESYHEVAVDPGLLPGALVQHRWPAAN